jgi:hypothetical protein
MGKILLRLQLAAGLLFWVYGARIPLDIDMRSTPFLQSTLSSVQGSTTPKIARAPFTWSHMYLGKLLHQSRVVELGPRGALFVMYPHHESTGGAQMPLSASCSTSEKALCVTSEGEVLPSALLNDGTAHSAQFNVTATPWLLQESMLRTLGHLLDACKLESNGGARVYYADGRPEYTVTACDVVQGTHVLVYEPRLKRVSLRAQTFGPAAYVICLLSATMHIAFLASPAASSEAWFFPCNCLLSVVACLVLYLKGEVQFHTLEDEVFFWISGAYALGALLRRRDEAYLFALSMMAAALYRTHETPYAPILGYVLGYRAWMLLLQETKPNIKGPYSSYAYNPTAMNKLSVGGKGAVVVTAGAVAADPQNAFGLSFTELVLMLVYTSLFCEIAIKPLLMQGGMWTLQMVFHMFVTYSLAKYRELSIGLPP